MNIIVLRPLWFGCLCRYEQNSPAPPLLYPIQFRVGKTPAPFCRSELGDISVNYSVGDSLKTAMAMTHLAGSWCGGYTNTIIHHQFSEKLSMTRGTRTRTWTVGNACCLWVKNFCSGENTGAINIMMICDHIISISSASKIITPHQKVSIFNVDIYCLAKAIQSRFYINCNMICNMHETLSG